MTFMIAKARSSDEWGDPIDHVIVYLGNPIDTGVIGAHVAISKDIANRPLAPDVYSWNIGNVSWYSGLLDLDEFNFFEALGSDGVTLVDALSGLSGVPESVGLTCIEFNRLAPSYFRIKSYIKDSPVSLWTYEFDWAYISQLPIITPAKIESDEGVGLWPM